MTDKEPNMDEHGALERAVEAAWPGACAKSNRGVIIWQRHSHGLMEVSSGFNHPPKPFACDGSVFCRAACAEVCVHAEAHALMRAGVHAVGSSMLHVKVVDGEAVPSGPPSCVRCSALILDAGIAWMWLLHDDGLKKYSAVEFHRLSLEYHGLPTGVSR